MCPTQKIVANICEHQIASSYLHIHRIANEICNIVYKCHNSRTLDVSGTLGFFVHCMREHFSCQQFIWVVPISIMNILTKTWWYYSTQMMTGWKDELWKKPPTTTKERSDVTYFDKNFQCYPTVQSYPTLQYCNFTVISALFHLLVPLSLLLIDWLIFNRKSNVHVKLQWSQ